jgi:hypothetical protein
MEEAIYRKGIRPTQVGRLSSQRLKRLRSIATAWPHPMSEQSQSVYFVEKVACRDDALLIHFSG